MRPSAQSSLLSQSPSHQSHNELLLLHCPTIYSTVDGALDIDGNTLGAFDGTVDGVLDKDGNTLGAAEGTLEGSIDGPVLGFKEGELVGVFEILGAMLIVGFADDFVDGSIDCDGRMEGFELGSIDGINDTDGAVDGLDVGSLEGEEVFVGILLGEVEGVCDTVGLKDGIEEGLREGISDSDGDIDGLTDGLCELSFPCNKWGANRAMQYQLIKVDEPTIINATRIHKFMIALFRIFLCSK